ncbi:serine/threonine-protein phosphatase 6 regulatory subunit 3-like protein [Carex littledalei]|uniref:Serine/threonine-protein phosphatase 6 regulatory subunit 3-like protein n=1 Tax=Carex littledalei TaxID=544730 RepID=A0A833RF16_9POAL|nr:serine/threonine-protein phosphatase 6 regulatory subunit 3-like protein [Carex littledalei]
MRLQFLHPRFPVQSFVGRLFHHALEESRPKSVLVHSLSVCIPLPDPKKLASASYQAYRSNLSHGTVVTASPETVDGMLSSRGDLLKLLEISSNESTLPTTYGHLQSPFGKHRLKVVQFISVLLTIGSESAEKELVQYPFNNFLHNHVENILVSCLESNKSLLIDHVLVDCKLVDKILNLEKNPTLSTDPSKKDSMLGPSKCKGGSDMKSTEFKTGVSLSCFYELLMDSLD